MRALLLGVVVIAAAVGCAAWFFFFNQDGLLPHEDGPLQVAVPRSDLASVLK